MLTRLAWLFRVPAVAIAAIFLLAGAYFGSTRDFGAFLISLPALSLLFCGTLIATVWAACIRAQRRRAYVAMALICLTPAIYLGSYGALQRIRFLFWAPAHYRELAQASRRDGIIMGWDSWGMAGSDSFSYLAVDTEDGLQSKVRAAQWTKAIGQTCSLWQAQRMWPKLYVVTTYTNCPYDDVQPAG
jgi:hypothetical protein